MSKSDDGSQFIPVIASSLLNAIYSRISLTNPKQIDDQIFNKEATIVLRQWGFLRQIVEKDYWEHKKKEAEDLQKAMSIFGSELSKVQSRLAELGTMPQSEKVQAEKKSLEEKLQVLASLAARFQA